MPHNFVQGLAGFAGLGSVVVAQGHHGDDPRRRGNLQNVFDRLGIKGTQPARPQAQRSGLEHHIGAAQGQIDGGAALAAGHEKVRFLRGAQDQHHRGLFDHGLGTRLFPQQMLDGGIIHHNKMPRLGITSRRRDTRRLQNTL